MVKRSPVLAVVLNWNRADLTCTCVSHVLAQRGADADLLVLDNGSTDDSVGTIRASGLDVAVTALDRNCGFAAGMNVGLQHALDHGYEFVWLLNNDAFADPHCLATSPGPAARAPASPSPRPAGSGSPRDCVPLVR